MAFFDDSFMKKENEKEELHNKETSNNQSRNSNQNELEINKKNREAYEDLMKNSQTSYDSYFDKNNVFVKLVLFLLFVFIVIGSAYYLLQYFSTK